MELTFGEQILIMLKRKKMSVQDLAALLSASSAEPVSGRDLARQLSADNFPEKEMERLARVLGCRVRIDLIPEEETLSSQEARRAAAREAETDEARQASSVGSFPPLFGENADPSFNEPPAEPIPQRDPNPYYIEMSEPDREMLSRQVSQMLSGATDRRRRAPRAPEPPAPAEAPPRADGLAEDCINPLTGEEYLNNSVRVHPEKAGVILVYDRAEHAWTETSEAEFRRFQIQKRAMLGDDYEPPIWL